MPVRARLSVPALLALTGFGQGAAACNPQDLSAVAPGYNVDFETQVMPLFKSTCVGCHGFNGNLSLEFGQAWFNLVNVPSHNANNSMVRVAPGDPAESFLFWKVNCLEPELLLWGSRMPFGEPPLALADQALILDWIAEGAFPERDPDKVWLSGFESRGPSPVLPP